MKTQLMIVLLLIVSCLYSESFDKRFLVKDQDLPEAIKLSYHTNKNDYRQFAFDSYLWAGQSKNQFITLGVSACEEHQAVSSHEEKHLSGAYTNLFYSCNRGDKWFLTSYQSLGNFSEGHLNMKTGQVKYYQISGLGYKTRDNLNFQTGFLYSTNYQKPLLLPFVGLTWSGGKHLINLSVPLYFEYKYRLHQNITLVGKAMSDVKSYRLKNNEYLQIKNNQAKAGLDFKLNGTVSLNLDWIFYHKINGFLQSSENDKFHKENQPLLSMSLKLNL